MTQQKNTHPKDIEWKYYLSRDCLHFPNILIKARRNRPRLIKDKVQNHVFLGLCNF